MFGFQLWTEYANFAIGATMITLMLPLVGTVVGMAVLWDGLDRLFMGRPQDGLLMSKIAPAIFRFAHPYTEKYVKKPRDSFIIVAIFGYAVCVPLMLLGCAYYTHTYGFSFALVLAYHVLRIGPYFMNFAYAYTLCHKEGHFRTGFFTGRLNKSVLRYVFNWWVGLYYGVMPSSFWYGHSVNHHRYNNGPMDVISTSDKPRDSFLNWVAYLPRFTAYALNISTTIQFIKEGDYRFAAKTMMGTVTYATWIGLWCMFDVRFTAAFLLYPLMEAAMLLAVVNWSWHAFLDPSDPECEFVGSLTIIDGPINVLNEDYHVVHHLYPGAHWTDHERLFKKHEKEYAEKRATAFTNTHAFEVFFMVILRDYDMLADKFVDLKHPNSTKEERIALLKTRLHACWWGPRANLDVKLQGKEVMMEADIDGADETITNKKNE